VETNFAEVAGLTSMPDHTGSGKSMGILYGTHADTSGDLHRVLRAVRYRVRTCADVDVGNDHSAHMLDEYVAMN
jgi:hypothetical protein